MTSNGHADCDSQVWSIIEINKDNLTAIRTTLAPAWVSASEFRGTMAILQSCVLTLVACIYTAIHLDVPEEKHWLSVLLTKAQSVLLALLAPEIVLFCAANQYIAAYRFKKQLQELQAKSETSDKEFNFDMKYAFFVIMGGVHIKVSKINRFLSDRNIDKMSEWYEMDKESKDELFSGRASHRTFPLNAQGILDLSRHNCWVYIPKLKIDAKSKADYIQKALVLLQVSWFALQCTVRRGYGLPLTLLELHTIVHVLCAIVLYIFWFKKPLDVLDPEIVYDEAWDNALALLVQKTIYHDQIKKISRYPDTENAHPEYRSATEAPKDQYRETGQQLRCAMLPELSNDDVPTAEELNRFRAIDTLFDHKPGKAGGDLCLSQLVFPESFDSDDRIERCFNTKNPNLAFFNRYTGKFNFSVHLLMFSVRNQGDHITENLDFLALSTAIPLVFGGIHLCAWNFEFPTLEEKLLWKIASIVIVAAVPAYIITWPIILLCKNWLLILIYIIRECDIHDVIRGIPYDVVDEICKRSARTFASPFRAVCVGIYIITRAFLVVEAFISLRRVPVGVYWTPAWLQMIPHV